MAAAAQHSRSAAAAKPFYTPVFCEKTGMLCICLLLFACSQGQKSAWDNYDYATISRGTYARDNDADYRFPTVSCVDDAPNCQ